MDDDHDEEGLVDPRIHAQDLDRVLRWEASELAPRLPPRWKRDQIVALIRQVAVRPADKYGSFFVVHLDQLDEAIARIAAGRPADARDTTTFCAFCWCRTAGRHRLDGREYPVCKRHDPYVPIGRGAAQTDRAARRRARRLIRIIRWAGGHDAYWKMVKKEEDRIGGEIRAAHTAAWRSAQRRARRTNQDFWGLYQEEERRLARSKLEIWLKSVQAEALAGARNSTIEWWRHYQDELGGRRLLRLDPLPEFPPIYGIAAVDERYRSATRAIRAQNGARHRPNQDMRQVARAKRMKGKGVSLRAAAAAVGMSPATLSRRLKSR